MIALARGVFATFVIVVAAVYLVCCGPQIGAHEPHDMLSPDTPDQLCMVCHLPGNPEAPESPHPVDSRRHQGCTRCHGPRHAPEPRGLTW